MTYRSHQHQKTFRGSIIFPGQSSPMLKVLSKNSSIKLKTGTNVLSRLILLTLLNHLNPICPSRNKFPNTCSKKEIKIAPSGKRKNHFNL